jgi:hypothetical protein
LNNPIIYDNIAVDFQKMVYGDVKRVVEDTILDSCDYDKFIIICINVVEIPGFHGGDGEENSSGLLRLAIW